jgi:hypothetical protein
MQVGKITRRDTTRENTAHSIARGARVPSSFGRTEGQSALRKEITPTSSFPRIGRLHFDQSQFGRHYLTSFRFAPSIAEAYVGTAALGCPVRAELKGFVFVEATKLVRPQIAIR